MLEQRRERVLLGAVLALVAILGVRHFVLGPLWEYVSGIDERIADVRGQLAEAEADRQTDPKLQRRSDSILARMRPASEQGENDFRQYLQSRLDPQVKVTGSKPVSVTPLPQLPGLRRLTFELDILGPLEPVRAALQRLDTSDELLHVENLQITNSSIDDPR